MIRVILQVLNERNTLPCWISYYREASSAGIGHGRILSRVREAASDVWGGKTDDAIVGKLREVFGP